MLAHLRYVRRAQAGISMPNSALLVVPQQQHQLAPALPPHQQLQPLLKRHRLQVSAYGSGRYSQQSRSGEQRQPPTRSRPPNGGSSEEEAWYPAKPSKSSLRQQLQGEVLYGVAPILAALRAGRRTPHALLLQEGLDAAQRKDGRALSDIQRLAAAAGAELRSCSKHDLNMLTDSRPHQGLVLDCSPLEWESLEQLPSPADAAAAITSATGSSSDVHSSDGGESSGSSSSSSGSYPVWLALDEVTDPQNLGAMVRSAYCLGAAGVLATSKNCAPLSAVVSKASAGAVEVLPLHSCRNMQRTLADAAAKGWAVLGAAAGPDSTPVTQWQVTQPTILVMGNEGYGLRTVVRRTCTHMVSVEMAAARTGPASARAAAAAAVESLNVSVATGILLHQLIAAAAKGAPAGAQAA